MQRPVISMGNLKEAHSITEPMANINPPRANVRVRDILSDRGPAARDARDAVIKIAETIKPCSIGEMGSKVSLNCGMTVTGPMDPVVSAIQCYSRCAHKLIEYLPVSNPNMKPPILICEPRCNSCATGSAITKCCEHCTPNVHPKIT